MFKLFKELFNSLKQRYTISYIDLADTGETNRLHLLVAAPIIFLFGVIDLLVIFIFHFHDLRDQLISIIYFSIYTIASIYIYVHAICVKNVSREKAYLLKTIPAYAIIFISFGAAVYNFYILKQPFNGVLIVFITGFLTLMTFSLSPFVFFIGLAITTAVLSPGILANFGVTGLMDSILSGILIFCFSIYKRRTEKRHIIMLKKQKKNLEAKTFGNFTLIYEDQVLRFSRTKSLELLGYLIYKRGSSTVTKELISVLWGDHADSARYGSSLRNLIVDIKHTMNELEIQNFFVAEYNSFRINPEVIKCDYYDFLSGDPKAVKSFAGEFMSQFSWAEEVAGFLEQKALTN